MTWQGRAPTDRIRKGYFPDGLRLMPLSGGREKREGVSRLPASSGLWRSQNPSESRPAEEIMEERIIRCDPDKEYLSEEGCFILELLNSSGDEGLSIARARVQPGVTTRLHRLRGVAERYLILQGEGLVEIGKRPPADVRAGDIVLIPPGCPQRITNTADSDLVFIALCTPRFTPRIYEDLDGPIST